MNYSPQKKVESLYDEFNQWYFNNTLPLVPITIINDISCGGHTTHDRRTKLPVLMLIPVNIANGVASLLHATLLHEMIHISEMVKHKTSSHGEFFNEECERLYQLGVNVRPYMPQKVRYSR